MSGILGSYCKYHAITKNYGGISVGESDPEQGARVFIDTEGHEVGVCVTDDLTRSGSESQ